jgi:hypothetical protein
VSAPEVELQVRGVSVRYRRKQKLRLFVESAKQPEPQEELVFVKLENEENAQSDARHRE